MSWFWLTSCPFGAPSSPCHHKTRVWLDCCRFSQQPSYFLFLFSHFLPTWRAGWCKPFLGALESVARRALPSSVNTEIPLPANEQRGAPLRGVLCPDWINRERDTRIYFFVVPTTAAQRSMSPTDNSLSVTAV